MLQIVSAMGYGDCLITLSLIERLGITNPDFQIIGTAVTARVSALLNKPLPVVELLPDKAAFYTVKEDGPWKALADLFSVRRSLSRLSRPGDLFAFERWDLRNLAVKPILCRGIYAPQTHHAYGDRQTLIRELFGQAPEWVPANAPQKEIRTVTLNPCARYRHKWLTPEIIEHVIAIASQQGWTITLLDPSGEHEAYRDRVRYVAKPSLAIAASMLKASDLYIGPDSFFIHLAYYYRIPLFGIFVPGNKDFRVPGMSQIDNFMDLNTARDGNVLEKKLMAFVATSGRGHDKTLDNTQTATGNLT
ncbi:MAG: hypothetical protein ACRETW_07475 [Stenotrophobium sp.]